MSDVTGFTGGSDWDVDRDRDGDDDEEWEGGEEVKARKGRRKKDEPMSPVAVVCESRGFLRVSPFFPFMLNHEPSVRVACPTPHFPSAGPP